MPNKHKHTNNFKNFQGTSSKPSTLPGQSNGGLSRLSVNQKLSELRKLDSSQAIQKKREIAESVSQKSVPPQIKAILGVPPKREVRVRERWRTPGPAPPRSWVNGSVNTAAGWVAALTLRKGYRQNVDANNDVNRRRPKVLLRFAKLCKLEDESDQTTGAHSLSHLAMKKVAENLDLFENIEQSALADVSLKLRLRLLSYVNFYGPALEYSTLQAFFYGTEHIHNLDLAGLIGHRGLSLRNITNLVRAGTPKCKSTATETILDSWDEVDTLECSPSLSLSSNQLIGASKFSHLTHLCLSHPTSAGASWRELLNLSKHTPQLTHLSLAYWPRPTLTPNLATATIASAHAPGEINAGGSHYYSALDQDFIEPAMLLQQLSRNLLCLEWLDLEGCTEWVPALERLAIRAVDTAPSPTLTPAMSDGWSSDRPSLPPVLASNWTRLAYIRISQGWLPTKLGFNALVSGTGVEARWETWDRIKDLPDHSSSTVDEPPQDTITFEKKKARIWLENETTLASVAARVNSARRYYNLPSIRIEYDSMKLL